MIRRLALAASLAPTALAAQAVLHGTVRDSTSGLPVPGAIVTLLDSTGAAMTRNLSNERGLYRATLIAGARRVRVLRLGFRPRELAIPPGDADPQLDVSLQSIPFLLSAMRVEAGRNCPRRADRAAALALLEQARAGLLATVVSRAEPSTRMTRLAFQRTLDDDARFVHQRVRLDSTSGGARSFGAAAGGRDFVRLGFLRDTAGSRYFLAPDAETLLDDGFATGYCFHVMAPDSARPSQVGLGFAPGTGRRPLIEIAGALWIDTVARSLVDIEFRYTGLGPRIEALRPGGRVAFRDMGNGTALVDRWTLRLVGPGRPGRDFLVEESGGELAHAEWADGHVWDASLGTARLHAVRLAGGSAPGTVLQLDDTDYRGTTDSTGTATFPQLVPGPYQVAVADPRLATLGVALRTPLAFTVERGATFDGTVVVPSPEDFVAARCAADHRFDPGETTWVVGRVVDANGAPVEGVSIALAEVQGGAERALPGTYTTGSDGLFQFCTGLRAGMTLGIHAARRRHTPVVVTVGLDSALTVVRVPF